MARAEPTPVDGRRGKVGRRSLLVFVVAVSALLILVHLPSVQRALASRALSSLAAALDSEMTIEDLSAVLFSGSVHVRNLELRTWRDGKVCTRISVGEVAAAVSVPALLRGDVVVHSLRVTGVCAAIGRDGTGEIVLPRLAQAEERGDADSGTLRLRFERVELVDAKVVIQPDRDGRTIGLSGLRASGDLDLASLSGTGSMATAAVWVGEAGVKLEEHATLRWRLAAGAGDAELELNGPIGGRGRVSFSDLVDAGSYRGAADLEAPLPVIAEALAPELAVAGVLRAQLALVDGGELIAELRAEGLTVAGLASRGSSATASYKDGVLELSQLTLEPAAGMITGRGSARLTPDVGDITLDVEARGLDLAELLAPLASGVEVAGVASGSLELAAPTPDLDAVVATVHAAVRSPAIVGRPPGVLRPQIALDARLAGGVVDFAPLELRDGATTLIARGRLHLADRTWRGRVEASMPDLAPYLAIAGLDGSGALDCRVHGRASSEQVSAEGEMHLVALRVGAFAMERAALELHLQDRHLDVLGRDVQARGVSSELLSAGLDLDDGGGTAFSLDAHGVTVRGAAWPDVRAAGELGPGMHMTAATDDRQLTLELRRAVEDGLQIDAACVDFRLQQLAPFVSDKVEDLRGAVTGTASLSLDSDARPIGGQIAVSALVASSVGHEIRLVEPVAARFEGKLASIDGLALALDGISRFDLKGSIDLADETVDLQVTASDLDLAPWGKVAGIELAGHVTAVAKVQGMFRRPELDGEVEVDGLRIEALDVAGGICRFSPMGNGSYAAEISLSGVEWDGHSFGSVLVNARSEGEGVRVDAALLDDRVTGSGTVATSAPWEVDGALSFDRLDAQLLQELAGYSVGAQGSLTGELRLAGELADPRRMSIAVRVPEVELSLAEVSVAGELDADIAGGLLRVNSATLTNPSMSVTLSGELPFGDGTVPGGRGGLILELHGGLGVLLMLLPSLDHADGSIEGRVVISGNLGTPVFSGALMVADGSVDGPAFPAPVEQIAGRIEATTDGIMVPELKARFAGGIVEASGGVVLAGDTRGALDGTLRVRGVDAPLSPSFDLSGEADLRLGGTLAEPRLSGELRVQQATYTPKIDVLALLRSMTDSVFAVRPKAPVTAVVAQRRRTTVNLDLLVIVPGTFEVVGSAVNAAMTARLQVAGSTEKPRITGGITVDEGEIQLFGSEFELTNGALDFIDPEAVDPELLITAVTRKGGDRITVAITGRASKPYLQLSSDAGLSQEEIITILAGGVHGSTGALSTDLLVNAAARNAASAVATRIGLASDVEIVPFPVTPEGDKLLFLVGKELGRGFVVRYGLASESGETDVVEVVAEIGSHSVARVRQNTDGTLSGGLRFKGTIR